MVDVVGEREIRAHNNVVQLAVPSHSLEYLAFFAIKTSRISLSYTFTIAQ